MTNAPHATAGFPKTDATQAFSAMAEKGSAQAKEAFEKMSTATAGAAALIKDSYSTAVKGAQDYNNKVLEFAPVSYTHLDVYKRQIVALARRLAVIMHRIWVDGTEFRWTCLLYTSRCV